MNPYGRWRCKGKNHPAPEKGHVTPAFLRLDSTGEITSDSCSADRYIPDMGTLFDSAFMKLHGRVEPATKSGFMDFNSTSDVMPMHMGSDIVLNQIKQNQAMNAHSKDSPYSGPHWGYDKKIPTQPNNCAFSNFRNSCYPEFKNFQHQKTGFHPAMTGHHLGQRYPNRVCTPHRGPHLDGHGSNRRQRHSFPNERAPSDCTNWRKSSQEKSLRDDCPISQDRVESTTEVTEPLRRGDSTSQTLSHSKNVIDNKKETTKPVINIKCAMPSQKRSQEDLTIEMEKPDQSKVPATVGKEHDKGSNGQKSASVQIFDWFDRCGQSEEIGGSDVPQRIGFRVRTVSIDSESSTDSSVVNNKTLQREASVLSDIFQPDMFHVTCMFKENDSMAGNKEHGKTTENQPKEHQSCQKDNNCESAVEGSNTESPQSVNCAEKKSEPSDLEKDFARRLVLLLRSNNKKGCRPSAKKRRRSKARKEDPSEIPSCQAENEEQKTQYQEKMCKEKSSSQKSCATKKSGSANTVAFVLGFESNNSPVNPLQQHSFLVSFDSDSDDFSEDSGDDFSDSDGVDELDFFSCPLQLNVICPVKQPDATASTREPTPTNSCESEERQKILDVNLKWSMNFSISQQEKSKTKVTFTEGDELCTVYDLDDEEDDRKGHWEEFVRDRERFQRRIADVGEIMKPVLSMERRDRIYHQHFRPELKRDYLTDDY